MMNELVEIERSGQIEVNGLTFPLPIKVGVQGDKAFMWKVTGRGQSSSSGQFCWLCKCSARRRHLGQPGGCLSCREHGEVYGSDGTQACMHHDIVSPETLQHERNRLNFLRQKILPHIPLTARPIWRNVPELRDECLKRAKDDGEKNLIRTYREIELQEFLLERTKTGCVLGESPSNGVRKCDFANVNTDLVARGLSLDGGENEQRLRLENWLQLEEEYLGLESAALDDRFVQNAWNAETDPRRHLVDTLHLPMRGNEKIIHMLKLQILELGGGKTKMTEEKLLSLDDVLREMGGFGEKWVQSYVLVL
jgi:hypothetical protein